MTGCNENSDSRWAIVSIKLAVASFVIIVLKLWTSAMVWVQTTNIWWFVAVFVIFAIKAGLHCGNSCCLIKRPVKKVAKKTTKKKK